jgi:hypothetical protein
LLTDVKDTGDVRVIQTAMRELRYAFRLFAPYAAKRKVTIFGSARTQPDKIEYQQAVEFGKKIVRPGSWSSPARAGHHAGRPRRRGRRKTVSASTSACRGNKARIPSSPNDKKLITFKYFFTRKLIFIRHSDAIVLFPGGFGTMDEGLRGAHAHANRQEPAHAARARGQARRHLIGKRGTSTSANICCATRLISPDDLSLYQITDNADEAGENHHALLPEFSFDALRERSVRHPDEKCADRIRASKR